MKAIKRVCLILLGVILVFVLIVSIMFRNELRSVFSLKKLDEHPLYQMTYYGDYGFNDFLKEGARSDSDIETFITSRLSRGLIDSIGVTEGGGCTVFVTESEKGEVLFCRNYDYTYTPVLQLYTHPGNDYASVSTVELDYAGYTDGYLPDSIFNRVNTLGAPYMPWDGMNENGLAIALLAVPTADGGYDPDKVTLNTTTAIRLVLDKASTVEGAIDLLKQYNIYFSDDIASHFLIADKTGTSALIEYDNGQMYVVTSDTGYQVASNFIAHDGVNIGEGFTEFERYDTVVERIEGSGGYLTEDQIIELMAQVGIYYNGVDKLQWTVIYNLTTGEGKIFSQRDTDNIFPFSLSE